MTVADLKMLERKAYRSTFQDGLWDLFWGIMLWGIGLAPLFKSVGLPKPLYYFIVPLLALAVLSCGKRWITLPRLGHVQFGPLRQRQQRILRHLRMAIAVFSLLLVGLSLTGHLVRLVQVPAVPVYVSLFVMGVLWMKAFWMDYPLLYLIGFFWALAMLSAEALYPHVGSPADGLYASAFFGSIIVGIGMVRLISFITAHPKEAVSNVDFGKEERADDS